MVTGLLPIWLLFRSLNHTAYDPDITHITFNMNALLDAEADRLCDAQRYERSEPRRDGYVFLVRALQDIALQRIVHNGWIHTWNPEPPEKTVGDAREE